jgi:hypothetical protein
VVLSLPQPHTAQGHGHAYQAPFPLSPRSSFQNRLSRGRQAPVVFGRCVRQQEFII